MGLQKPSKTTDFFAGQIFWQPFRQLINVIPIYPFFSETSDIEK